MNREALVITGLNPTVLCFSDEMPVGRRIKSDAEKFLSDGLGIKTTIFESNWKTRGSLDKLINDLDNQIDRIDDEVVLIGLSAGMTASLIAKNKYGEKIPKIISLCGWSREDNNLTSFERKKLDNLRLPNPVFGQAVSVYTEIHDNLSLDNWEKILLFWAEHDKIVPESCSKHSGMVEMRKIKGVGHVRGILLGLTKIGEMRRFIEAK